MIDFDTYSKAMRNIIMYDSLSEKQIAKMPMEQLGIWESKVSKAKQIKKEYEKQRKEGKTRS